MNAKSKAGLYCRVSTTHQADKASLTTQKERLTAYTTAHGHDIVDTYSDVGSGKDTKRSELDRLLADCRAGRVNVVLVTKLDRITQSTRDLDRLLTLFAEHEVTFVSISENIDSSSAMGRFMRDLLGLLTRLEREITGERVAADMRQRAEQGKFNGGQPPYGYESQRSIVNRLRKNGYAETTAQAEAAVKCPEPGKLYLIESEAVHVRAIFDRFLQTKSIRRTARDMNAAGLRTRNGKPWNSTSIYRILTNPTYTGLIRYARTATDALTGKFIKQAESILSEGKQDPLIAPDVSGLLKCGLCGSPMAGDLRSKYRGRQYRYYQCKRHHELGKEACPGVY
jgi:site-specific DNA recombinase